MPTNDPSTTSGVDPQPSTPESRLAELQRLAGEAGLEATARYSSTCCMRVKGEGCTEHIYCARDEVYTCVKPVAWTQGTPQDCIAAVLATRPQPITPPTPAPTTLEHYQAVASEVDPRLLVKDGGFTFFDLYTADGLVIAIYDCGDSTFDALGADDDWTPGTFRQCCEEAAKQLPAKQEPAEASGEGEAEVVKHVMFPTPDLKAIREAQADIAAGNTESLEEWANEIAAGIAAPDADADKTIPMNGPQLDEAAVEAAAKAMFFYPNEFRQERWDQDDDRTEYDKELTRLQVRRHVTAYLSALSHTTPAQHPGVATVGRVKELEAELLREQQLRQVDKAQIGGLLDLNDKLEAERDDYRTAMNCVAREMASHVGCLKAIDETISTVLHNLNTQSANSITSTNEEWRGVFLRLQEQVNAALEQKGL